MDGYIGTLLIFIMTMEFSWKSTESIYFIRFLHLHICYKKYQLECFLKRDIAYKFITTYLVGTMVTEDNGIDLEKALKMDEHQRKKIYTTYAPKPEWKVTDEGGKWRTKGMESHGNLFWFGKFIFLNIFCLVESPIFQKKKDFSKVFF